MKKINMLLLIISFILLPSFVSAACTSCSGNSGAIGGGTGNGYGVVSSSSDCTAYPCWYGQSAGYGGVRLSLYAYTQKDGPTFLGAIDIWGSVYKSGSTYITSPKKDRVLERRHGSNCYYKNNGFSSTYSSWNSYVDGENIYQISSLADYFKNKTENGDVVKFLYSKDGNNASGWLETNVFSYMRDGRYDVVADTFNIETKKVKSNLGKMYIVAELLMEVKKNSSTVYLGTVGELASVMVHENHINHMRVTTSFGKIGELTGQKNWNNDYIHEVKGQFAFDFDNGDSRYKASGKVCNNTYGMAIWYLPDCCPECTESCQETCDTYETGTAARTACATGYCNNHPEDGSDCIKTCTSDGTTENKNMDGGCDSYKCKIVSPTSNNSNPSSCEDKKGNVATFKANVCYDDDTEYSFLNVSGNANNTTHHENWSVKHYYKVSCTENTSVSDLPSKLSNAWLTKTDVGSLHLGFTLNYKKDCELFYKDTEGHWKKNFQGSKLQSDIASLKTSEIYTNNKLTDIEKQIKDKKNKDYLEDLKKEKETYKAILEQIQKAYKELAPLAPIDSSCTVSEKTVKINGAKGVIDSLLLRLTELDHNGTNYFSENIKLEVPEIKEDFNGEVQTTEDYLVLEPVACHETPKTTTTSTIEYCAWREDLKKYTTRTTTTTTTSTLLECDNVDENGNATPIEAKIAGNKYTATYGKTLYYELPDSYVLVHSDDDGKTFHSEATINSNNVVQYIVSAEKSCNDFLKKEKSYGKCLKKDNLYEFPQFKDKLLVDTLTSSRYKFNYELNISNIGYCGKELGKYTYSCSYQFKKDTECSKCSQYEKGTAEYKTCYQNNCSCEAVCNGSVACKQKYCPTNCESCGTGITNTVDVECDDCVSNCDNKYSADSDDSYMCQWQQCCNPQTNGNTQALADCCYNYCNKVSRGDPDKYDECVKTWCDCPECDLADDYVYRSVNINDPFNGRENEENGVGLNWRGKIGYITEENNNKSKQYYDSSNSFNTNGGTPEYTVDLSSSMIKSVKNKRKIGSDNVNTTYQVTRSSKSRKSKITTNSSDIVDPYCSYLLHDVFEESGILEQNDTAGMRCK